MAVVAAVFVSSVSRHPIGSLTLPVPRPKLTHHGFAADRSSEPFAALAPPCLLVLRGCVRGWLRSIAIPIQRHP